MRKYSVFDANNDNNMLATSQKLCCTSIILSFCVWGIAPPVVAFDGRIVNGTQAKEGEFPFVLSLRRAADGRHKCGASLINRAWALTAAHCVVSAQPHQVNLQYGSITLEGNNSTNVANISKIVVHEDYEPRNQHVNDIALLRLEVPLKLNAKVRAVHLPAALEDTAGNTSVTLIGWGFNATGGIVQKHLQKVHLQTFTDEECSSRHGTQLYATTLCAGVPEGGKGQCSGDSGGPLLVNGTTQVGIVSWSRKPCTIAPFPGVYTEVAAYVDWIGQTLSKDRDEGGEWDGSEESWEELSTGNLIIVSLRYSSGTRGHFCAGTIVHPQWILTAAHCFTYVKQPQEFHVQYNTNQLYTNDAAKLAPVAEIIKHEGYSATIAIHDIALLKLNAPLHYDKLEMVKYARLDEVATELQGSAVLLGWGLNATVGILQQQLQKVTLKIYSRAECQQKLNSQLHKTNFCAGDTVAQRGQCSGDSGGPLLLPDNAQVGIVSWSLKPCAIKPGVYTNVAYYADWIDSHIEEVL